MPTLRFHGFHQPAVRVAAAANQALSWANPVRQRPTRQGVGLYRIRLKRLCDIVATAALLIVTTPFVVIAMVVVARDGVSPIFGHRRIGRRGRPFICYKLRSMVPDAEAALQRVLASDPAAAEEWAHSQKLTNDPRVTRFGSLLRRMSIDELPQLWNVLRGDMSLVGPRPVTRDEIGRYGAWARKVLSVRPGVTGLWQVSGRNSLSYEERVRLDALYVDRLSFLEDLRILVLTLLAVLGRTGR